MNHKVHLYVMGGALVVGAVLLLTGTGGASPYLLAIGACMAMMFFMMRGMSGMGGMGSERRSRSGEMGGQDTSLSPSSQRGPVGTDSHVADSQKNPSSPR